MHFFPPTQTAAKHDPALEGQAVEWIVAITGDGGPEGKVQEWLKDGTVLCKLINVLSPNAIRKINESKMAFKMVSALNTPMKLTLD